jgi:hypothetical protein
MGFKIVSNNWDLDRFVEYNSPLQRNEILSSDNNSSHWTRNEVVFDLK